MKSDELLDAIGEAKDAYIQDFLQSPGYDGAGSWSCRVTRLSLAPSHCAHCWSRIRVSWHPGPGHRPLFLGRPLGAWLFPD